MDMDLGVSLGLGINSTSPLRPNPMRPRICNDQVFKLHLLVRQIFFFLSQTTMSSINEQFVAEAARMAAVEAELVKQKAELVRLWKVAVEEVKWKAEEEQQWKEEEERVEEERKWKEEEEKKRVEEKKRREVEEHGRGKEMEGGGV